MDNTIDQSYGGPGVDQLKARNQLHLARKIYHVVGVAFIVILYLTLSRMASLTLLGSAILIFVPLDYLRRKIPVLQNIALKGFGPVLRKDEEKTLSGMSMMMVGIFITAYLFPPSIVILSLLLLGLGDPISSIVGTIYGKDKIVGNKSLQGTLAGFVVCTVASFTYFVYTGIMSERLLFVSLLAGLIGAISELVPIGRLDDNFTIPIMSSTLLFGLFYLFGGF